LAARITPSRGGKPDKLARDAIMVALNREVAGADGQPTKRLYVIADKLVERAAEGDLAAIKEVIDRVDGKAHQGVSVAGDEDGGPLIQRIEYMVVDPADDQSGRE